MPTSAPSNGPPGGASGSIQMPVCLRDNRKMTMAASLCTMIYSVLCVGFLVNELMDVTTSIDAYEKQPRGARQAHDAPGYTQKPEPAPPKGVEDKLFELTVTKIMYTVLICNLVLLLVSSVALLKGIFQKKQSLIIAWVLIIVATMVYAGALITRDIHIQLSSSQTRHLSGTVSAKLGFYSFFVIMEAGFMRFVVLAFKDVRRARALRRTNTAVFDPRNPGHSLFTVSGSLTPQRPETLFKLPSYEEVTSDSTPGTSSENKTEDKTETPPPYEPPAYVP